MIYIYIQSIVYSIKYYKLKYIYIYIYIYDRYSYHFLKKKKIYILELNDILINIIYYVL